MSYSGRMGTRTTTKRLPRHLRNEDLPRDVFTPRTYQVELLDSARRRNTVVCMGSSSGRTFIAVMLMKEMSTEISGPLSDGGKRSVYLVNSDEMVEQQVSSIQHPANIAVGVYTSTCGIDTWTDQQWKQDIEKSEALVMTGAVFLDLLQRSILGLHNVNLLVLDDCHLTLQPDHPYRDIMNIYKAADHAHRPRILGLTSNILHGQVLHPENLEKLVTSLEEALQSTAETSTLVISERYGLSITEKVLECEDYEDATGLNDKLYTLLENAIDFLDECNMKPSEDTDNRDPCLIPKAALIECHNILTQLGPWCCSCLADMLIGQIEKIEKQKETNTLHKRFFKMASTTLRSLSTVFDKHFKQCEYSIEELLKYSTPKVTQLMNCLRKFKPETDFVIISEEITRDDLDDDAGSDSDMSDDDDDMDLSDNEDDADPKSNQKQVHVAVKKFPPEDETKAKDPFSLEEDKYLCGLVFVENQHEAYALNKFIEEVCSWDEGLCFVKSQHLTAAKSARRGEKRLFRKQEEVLRKFRMQELNLIVSTSVLEEGVDVPKCNLVIRFDVPKNYRSYSQSKGRARARDAEYLLLVEEENFDELRAQLKVYKQIEEVLIRQCNKVLEDPANEVGDSAHDSEIQPFIPSSVESHIKVTLETSIMLVNRYCAKLPSDAFTHLTPSCTVVQVETDGQTVYSARLRLPINSPIKDEIEGPTMSTKQRARQAVALKMCEILHKEGELDDHLMPVGKEMFQGDDWDDDDCLDGDEDEDLLGEARPGTTKRKQYYCKKVASALLQSHPMADTPCYLYIINMTLTGAITEEQNTRGRKIYAPEDTPRGFGILTSKAIPLVPMFPVFTRSGEVTVGIDVQRTELVLSEEELGRLKTFHKFLFSNVLRLEKDPMDYQPCDSNMGYVVVPLNRKDENSPTEIDWEFTEKVEKCAGVPNKPKQPGETFEFNKEDFEDAVVMPSYRNIDQPQYFYVAEIRHDLNPLSPFPSPELYKTFAEYYTTKYGLTITNLDQPLLDVDHTSARLNLLIPRYMNQKGVPLPTSSAETKKARRENLQQKQILIPELCDIHVFLATLWKKAVCLPAILYRMNYLLLAEEIRKHVAKETKIGVSELPDGYRFQKLDFGFDTSPESLKPLTAANDETEEKDKDENVDGSWESNHTAEDTCKHNDNNEDITSESNLTAEDTCKHNDNKENEKEHENEKNNDNNTKDSVKDQDICGDTLSKENEKNNVKVSDEEVADVNLPNKVEHAETKAEHAEAEHEYAAAKDNCDTMTTQCNNISGKATAGETAGLTDPKCNKNTDEPIAITGIEFDVYAKDELIDKDCDKPDPFSDPLMTFQNSARDFADDKSAGLVDENEDAGMCELCTKANNDLQGLGIVGLTLSSCPKCASAKDFNIDEIKPKIIELSDDVDIDGELSKKSVSGDLVNGFAELKVNPDEIDVDKDSETPVQNGFGSDYEDTYNGKDSQKVTAERSDITQDSQNGTGPVKEGTTPSESIHITNSDSAQEGAKNRTSVGSEIASEQNSGAACTSASEANTASLSSSAVFSESLLTPCVRSDSENTAELDKLNLSEGDSHERDMLETAKEDSANATIELPESSVDNKSEIKESEQANENAIESSDATIELPESAVDKESELKESEQTNENATESADATIELPESAVDKESELKESEQTNENAIEPDVDVFANMGKFMPKKKATKVKVKDEVDLAIPLISLDQDIDLPTFIGPSPCDILQALTMSNANDFFSLERLETIGDSFLKYAITVYLYCSYPGIHEGKLSYLRSKQVSNYNLYRLGKRKGLSECMISTKFEPYENWLPPGFTINECKRKGPVPKVQVATMGKSSSTIFSSTIPDALHKSDSIAELTAALHNHKTEMKNFSRELEEADQISRAKDEEFAKGDKGQDTGRGWSPYSLQLHHCLPDKSIADCVEALIGCYLTSCDKMAALLFMSWMGLKVLPRRIKDSPPAVENLNVMYDRLPCPNSPFLSTSRNADEVLARLLNGYNTFEEKIGYVFRDRSYLLQAFTHASYHYNTVTDCYQRLEFLGDAVLDYVITRHLYEDSDKYSPGVLTDLRSALVNNNIFAALAVKWDFHKYFKAISPALFNVIEKFVARQKENEDEIDLDDDEADADHEKEHVELEVPKALGDIFESVAGAVYLDSGMSLDTVWRVFYKVMKPQIDKYLKNIPKSPVRELLEQEPETAKFDKPERTMDGKIRVTVNVVGKGVFKGVGRNYRIAKSAAAKKALKCIKTLEAEGLV